MRNATRRTAIGLALAMSLLLVLSACGGGGDTGGGGATQLVGLFKVTAGECSGSTVMGSYFRMVKVGGTVASGPYVANTDTPCKDTTYSPMKPGKDGGLRTGVYQKQPATVFDGKGNGLADLIVLPTKWFGTTFAIATNEKDPQTGKSAGIPTITVDAGKLSGNLAAYAAAWNGEHFNQGTPKPDGSMPGNTTKISGTYDSGTGKYVLEWASQIEGGPFNNFTGIWHLEGTFAKA